MKLYCFSLYTRQAFLEKDLFEFDGIPACFSMVSIDLVKDCVVVSQLNLQGLCNVPDKAFVDTIESSGCTFPLK